MIEDHEKESHDLAVVHFPELEQVYDEIAGGSTIQGDEEAQMARVEIWCRAQRICRPALEELMMRLIRYGEEEDGEYPEEIKGAMFACAGTMFEVGVRLGRKLEAGVYDA